MVDEIAAAAWSAEIVRKSGVALLPWQELRAFSMLEPPPLDNEVRDALGAFMASVTVPILYDCETKGVHQVGTGTLFTLDGRLFLVTAAHLFDGLDPERLGRFAIPCRRTTQPWSLGSYNLLKPKQSEFDVAVLELREDATIERAKASWRALVLANTATALLSGLFILCGFPKVRERRSGNTISGDRMTVFTARIPVPEAAEQPVHAALDLFFAYDEQSIDAIKKAPIPSLPLQGCSGASIWQYQAPSAGALWTPERCLKIVGVQSAYLPHQYFRAKSWAAVLEIMRQTDERLATIVSEYKSQQLE